MNINNIIMLNKYIEYLFSLRITWNELSLRNINKKILILNKMRSLKKFV